mmetsp:Transcript_31843/g.98364  ORF Transcript_31843/g.98364 Transcript_31843/m.98364 type:complete len:173 (+) Transcript_31843:120-638(+)
MDAEEILGAASFIQTAVRRWLARLAKDELQVLALRRRNILEKSKQQFFLSKRSEIFSALISSAKLRLIALRAEVASELSYNATVSASSCATQAQRFAKRRHSEYLRIEAGARWVSEYVAQRVANPIPAHVRQLLARASPVDSKMSAPPRLSGLLFPTIDSCRRTIACSSGYK